MNKRKIGIELFKLFHKYKTPMDEYNKEDIREYLRNIGIGHYKISNVPESHNDRYLSILESGYNGMFGSIYSLKDIRNTLTMAVVSNIEPTPEELSSSSEQESTELQLEHRTFFYFDFNSMYCSCVVNKDAPYFKFNFAKFLRAELEETPFEGFALESIIADDYVERIKRFNKITKFQFASSRSVLEVLDETGTISNAFNIAVNDFEKVKLEMILNVGAGKINSFVTKLVELKNKLGNSKNNTLQVSGVEGHDTYLLDLIEGYFKKYTCIEIEDEFNDETKEELKAALVTAIEDSKID